MHFLIIIIAIALFVYWKFFRPRQLEVFIVAIIATMITMTLVAIVMDDVKLGFLFVVSIIGWSKLFDNLLSNRIKTEFAQTLSRKLHRFLGRK